MKILFCLIMVLNAALALEFNNIQADFVQTIKSDDGTIEYTGKLVATKDSKAFWQYYTPSKKEIFLNNNQVVIYEPELKQAIVSKRQNFDFISILNSVKEVNGELISKIGSQTFRVVLKDNVPSKVYYKDELGNDAEITLKNVALNKKIDYKIFEVKLPSDTEMINE